MKGGWHDVLVSVNPRWLGLAATVLLAASGFLAGKPVPHDGAWLLGVVVWFVALAMLIRAWWTLRAETDQRGLLLTAALWSVPLLFAPPLGSHDVYAYACQGQLFNAGLDLYRVGPAELPCTWLSDVPELWRETPTPYGPLWIAVEGAAAWLAHGSLPAVVLLLRVAALLGLLLCIAAVHRLSRGNALLAASPLVLVHVVSGAHNDVVLAGLVLAGFVAARRPGPVAGAASGVAFGLAVAVKVTAIAAAPFALLLLFFAGTTRARWTAPAAFAGAAGAAYAILALLTGHGLGFLHALGSTSTMVQWLSVPTGVGMAAGYVLRVAGRPGGSRRRSRSRGPPACWPSPRSSWHCGGGPRAPWPRSAATGGTVARRGAAVRTWCSRRPGSGCSPWRCSARSSTPGTRSAASPCWPAPRSPAGCAPSCTSPRPGCRCSRCPTASALPRRRRSRARSSTSRSSRPPPSTCSVAGEAGSHLRRPLPPQRTPRRHRTHLAAAAASDHGGCHS